MLRKILKIVISLLIIFAFMYFDNANVYADELEDSIEVDTDSIYDNISPDAEQFIDDNNLSADNTDAMTQISFVDVLKYVWNIFIQKIKYPITVMSSIICVIIVCSLIDGAGDTISSKPLKNVYGMICTLSAVGIISNPISKCIECVSDTLNDGGNFMIGYVPVFAGITASSGNITSAAVYNTAVIVVAEGAIELASEYIMPVMSICMALGIIEAVNPSFSLSSITQSVTKAVKFILGMIMTIFIGLLSVQSIIGASADTIGIKAAKFMVSNCIPIIGGAVSDAYTTLKTGLGVLRSGTGFFGIAVIFITILPSALEIVAMRFVFLVTEMLADLFGTKQIKILAANSSAVLTIMFSLIICFSVMLIISTAVLMLTALNSM